MMAICPQCFTQNEFKLQDKFGTVKCPTCESGFVPSSAEFKSSQMVARIICPGCESAVEIPRKDLPMKMECPNCIGAIYPSNDAVVA